MSALSPATRFVLDAMCDGDAQTLAVMRHACLEVREALAALQSRLAAAESRAASATAEAARARGLRVEENIVVDAAILWAGRRSDDLPSAVNLLEAVNALLRKRAHLASRPEGEVRHGE